MENPNAPDHGGFTSMFDAFDPLFQKENKVSRKIDWLHEKGLLTQRGNKSLRIKNVHIMPEWIKTPSPVAIEWSNGETIFYTLEGRVSVISQDQRDVVRIVNSGRGWLNPDLKNKILFDEPNQDPSLIEIEWKQVTRN